MRNVTILASAFSALIVPVTAEAQVATGSPAPAALAPPPEENDQGIAASVQRTAQRLSMAAGIETSVANGPNHRSVKIAGGPEFELLAEDDNKVASLSWTLDVSGTPSGSGRLSSTFFRLGASTALDSDGDTSFGNFGRLSNGTEITLSLVHYESQFDPDSFNEMPLVVASDACRRQEAGKEDLQTLCDPGKFELGASAFIAKYAPAQLRSFIDPVLPGDLIFYGAEVSGNQAEFSYLDQAAFAMQDDSKFGYSGTVFLGGVFNRGNTSLTGSFTVSRQFDAQSAITLCQPINTVPQSQCITAAGGPPTRTRDTIAAVELRHAFTAGVGKFAKVAIAPQASFSLRDSAYAIDVPLYLVGNGEGKLRGGVRLNYVNSRNTAGEREGDVTFGVFLGIPFSVFR